MSRILVDRRAFSLVELSIVLVILGLLVGGVLAGQSLIRAAELRAVSTEYSRFTTAVQTFRDKYFALPGDMTNATAFWQALDSGNGTGSDCRGESTGLPTCNGDGNGRIETNSVSAASTHEVWLLWKHLANAGLIEGTYTGSSAGPTKVTCYNADGTYDHMGGCNEPASRVSGAGWSSEYVGSASADATLFDGEYGNVLALTRQPTYSFKYTTSLRADEVWGIDTKMDDGKPGTGNVVVTRFNSCTAANNTNQFAAAVYLLNNTSIRCNPVFRNVF